MPRINAGEGFGRVTVEPIGQAQMPANNSGRAMMQIGQRMEKEGLQQESDAAAAAKQQAREAAAEAKQQARELQQQREAADRARASSVLANTRDRIADTAAGIDQEIQDGRLPKTEAAKAWKERTAELLQASLGDVPETHRGLVQQDLQGYVGRFDSRVADSVRKRDQSDTRADLDSTLEALQRSAVGNLPQSKAQAMAALDTLGPAAGLRPDEIGKAKQRWVEGAAYTGAFTALNQAKNDNRALSKVEQSLQANSDIDPQRRAQLLAQLDGYRASNEARALRQAQQAEIAASAREREAGRAWDVLSGWALAGKAADPQANAALISKLDPARLSAYKALAAEIPARAAAAMQPLQAQQDQLDALKAQRVTRGTSPELEKEIDRREKVLSESKADYGRDPLRAAAERGIIDRPAPLDLSSFDGIAASVAGRAAQAQAVATRTGRAVSPLLPEEADRFAGLLAAVAPAQQGRMIAQLASVLPAGQMQALAGQIDAKDRPLALQMAAGAAKTSEGRTVAELIGRGRQAIKDKAIKEETGAEFGVRSQIAKTVGESIGGRWREDIVDAARLIYLGKQAEGTGLSIDGAVRLALGGEIVEHNGRRLPVPQGVNLPEALRRIPERAVSAQAPDGYVYASGRPIGVPEFLANLPSAQLEPMPGGKYAVISGGSRVTGANRQPIVLEPR
jgi:hypothetical protein